MTNSKATLSKLPEAQQEMLLEGMGHALKNWQGWMDVMLDAGTRINKAYKEIITIVDKYLKDKKR